MSLRDEACQELGGRWSFEIVDGRVVVRDVRLIRAVLEARKAAERMRPTSAPAATAPASPPTLF